ncbi:MAG: hypothetical protein MJ207_03370 [Bacilli bacterium]|nr:hypothetical protein [Bacilli bacterium]
MRKLNLLIPATLIVCCALTSCKGNNDDDGGRLKREEYSGTYTTLEGDLKGTLVKILGAQIKNKQNEKEREVFDLPQAGVMKANLDLDISGSFYFFSYNMETDVTHTFNLNNVKLAFGDSITVKWDLGHDYMGVSNKNGDSIFIKKTTQEGKENWNLYYVKPVAEKKYYRTINPKWYTPDGEKFENINNFLMYEMASNTGFFNEHHGIYDNGMRGFGFDISGFGYDFKDLIKDPESTNAEDVKFSAVNYLAPGLITNKDLNIDFEGINKPIYQIIDEVAAWQKDHPANIPLKHKYTKGNGNNLTINLKIDKLDLTNSKNIVHDIGEAIHYDGDLEKYIITEGSGDAKADYFVNFKDNWVHQQELTLDVNKANLKAVIPSSKSYTYMHLKNTDIHGYLNQEATLGKWDYKEPDIEGYEPLPFESSIN